jgi:hypothetical protein
VHEVVITIAFTKDPSDLAACSRGSIRRSHCAGSLSLENLLIMPREQPANVFLLRVMSAHHHVCARMLA